MQGHLILVQVQYLRLRVPGKQNGQQRLGRNPRTVLYMSHGIVSVTGLLREPAMQELYPGWLDLFTFGLEFRGIKGARGQPAAA